MKLLKQVALVTAVAAASGSAFAMEALTDEALSEKTGQDGLTVTITPSATGITIEKLLIHDNDGLAAGNIDYNGTQIANGGTATAGALVVNDLAIQGGAIQVDIDTDGSAGTDPFVNAAVSMNGTTNISLGGVNVGKSGAVNTAGYTGAAQRGATDESKILGGLSLALTDAKMNVQLGAQPQGAMVLMDAALTGGLKISNLEVIDANGFDPDTNTTPAAGGLLVKEIVLTDAAGANMQLAQKIDIDGTDGIVITMDSPTDGYYGYLTDVGISDGAGAGTLTSTIGDVEIQGLKLGASTIAIKGH